MQHFKAFIACHGAGRHAQELKVVEYVRFDTGKAGFRRAQTVGFNGKGDIFCFDKPVVALYGTYKYYRCVTSRKMDSGACTPHSIRIDKLEQTVLVTIQTMIDTALELDEIIEKIDLKSKNAVQSNLLQKSLDKNIAERDKYKNMMVDLYPDWKSGTITKEEYMTLKEGISERIKALDDKITELQNSLENNSNGIIQENDFITHFKQYGRIEKLTRPILTELVDTILVHEGGNITINFKFKDAYEQVIEYIEETKQKVLEEIA